MGISETSGVKGFQDTYIFVPSPLILPSFTKRGIEFTKRLNRDERVLWYETQKPKVRQKRDYGFKTPHRFHKGRPFTLDNTFNDELWPHQWYMRDTRLYPSLPKLDLNVLPVYKAGITGKGVRISILDDGIEYTHDDISDNYDSEISYDCNEEDYDPLPRYDSKKRNSHGTRCAGEVAMVANNNKCGIGIAFNAKVGGVKLLDGVVNDRIEGTALGFAHHLVDIYSASWGPNDDGKTVDGPGTLAQEALKRGTDEGRGGKGCVYVWASGNGGDRGDNCNCDGYLASPYTITIGSASQRGEFPWYGEPCASILAVTYSSGAYKDQMIATTDLYNQCTIKHTGTSASAPLAAGIIALALEANPSLSWRDVQHLIVWSSEVSPVADNPGWQKNAAGLWFNTRFGYGLMNAFGLVNLATNWTTVSPKAVLIVPSATKNFKIGYGNTVEVQLISKAQRVVASLEHVEVVAHVTYPKRGALEMFLTSPAGTRVQILNAREYDTSSKGFQNWTFMSVATWGERPDGPWTVTVQDQVGPTTNEGFVESITLKLHGTPEIPVHMQNGERIYDHNYNRLRKSFENLLNKEDERNGNTLSLI
ncbi:hypothetical protein PPYR_03850 [Photinus pyralis]|uniref:furin n=1 Tax=Photinus pyralis TaxID=7054 RepID=A0A5N4AWF7_PHOPY|nr:hypothetical protein PPYR_03850 [Photinus pyralis]